MTPGALGRTAAATVLCLCLAGGCGGGDSDDPGVEATVPRIDLPTLDEIAQIKEALRSGAGVPELPVPASVFEIESDEILVNEVEWVDLTSLLGEIRQDIVEFGWIIDIAGQTDTLGDEGYNQALSQARADAAKRYLVQVLSYPPDRVTAVGEGESGGSPEFRRVVFRFRQVGAN